MGTEPVQCASCHTAKSKRLVLCTLLPHSLLALSGEFQQLGHRSGPAHTKTSMVSSGSFDFKIVYRQYSDSRRLLIKPGLQTSIEKPGSSRQDFCGAAACWSQAVPPSPRTSPGHGPCPGDCAKAGGGGSSAYNLLCSSCAVNRQGWAQQSLRLSSVLTPLLLVASYSGAVFVIFNSTPSLRRFWVYSHWDTK